jgi:hypothetical protein
MTAVVAGRVGAGTGTGTDTGEGFFFFFSSEVTAADLGVGWGFGVLAALLLDLCISAMMSEAMLPDPIRRSQRGKRIAMLYTLARILAK